MDPKELEELLQEIDESGITDTLIAKLSTKFGASPELTKSILKTLIQLVNTARNG